MFKKIQYVYLLKKYIKWGKCFVARDTNVIYLVYLMYDQKLKKNSKYTQNDVCCLPVQSVCIIFIFLSNNLKTKTHNTLLRVVCLFVVLGVSYCEKNRGWARLRTEDWGKYLGPRGKKWHETGEKCKVRSFIIVGRTYGGDKKFLNDFVREHEGKRPLGRPRHRWKVNIIQVGAILLRSLSSFSFLLSLSVTFHQSSTLIFSSDTDAVWSEQVTLAIVNRQTIDAGQAEIQLCAA